MSVNGWTRVCFGDILRPNKRPYTLGDNEDANLVGMRLYGHGPFHRELKPANKIRKKTHFVIRANDVIYNKLFAWKGTFGIVPHELDGMFVSDKFPTYELNEKHVDRGFLRWYFRYPPLWEQARQMSTGSAALSKLTLNPPRFLELTIPLPPLNEQRRIAATIDRLSERTQEASRTRQEASLMVELYRRAEARELTKRFDRFGPLEIYLRCKPRNGWSPKCDNANDGTPVLTLSAVTGFTFNSTAFKRTSLQTEPTAHYWLHPGDLLVTRSNSPELVGHAAIYNGLPSPCIYSDLMMRVDVDSEKADTTFIWHWFQTPIVREYIRRNAKGTSPTMKKISQGVVMGIPVPVDVSISEQREFVACLEKLQATVDEVKQLQDKTATALNALLPSILDRAFRGEL